MRTVYVAAARRTPIGRLRGALASVRPDDLAATDIRPLASADMATVKPLPSAPSRAASGTRTSSKVSSAVAWPRSPSLP